MLTKFSSLEVLSADLIPGITTGALRRATASMLAEAESILGRDGGSVINKVAHRHPFEYQARPGYLYVRSRAISSRCNDNFDEFPAEEIRKAYATFIGKPVFVNHNNDNHRRARGVIIDAALHEDVNPDGSPDTWVEVLMEVDAIRFPKLAQAILAKHIDRTSMGTDVAFSVCSFCGNKATTPLEYCAHIPKLKGQRIYRTTASGEKEGVLVREICHGLGFFENSLLVEEPADPTAYAWLDGPSLAGTATRINRADFKHDFDFTHPPMVTTASRIVYAGIDNTDHVRSFQGRDIPKQGDRVAVYRDLSNAPRSGFDAKSSFSIKRLSPRGAITKDVVSHTTGIHIKNVFPTFSEAARQEAIETGKRQPHAFIGGEVHQYVGLGGEPTEPGWEQVSYYPDLGVFFMLNGRGEFQGADEAVLANGRMYVRGNIRTGAPVPLSPKYEQPAKAAALLDADDYALAIIADFNASEPRDSSGRWTDLDAAKGRWSEASHNLRMAAAQVLGDQAPGYIEDRSEDEPTRKQAKAMITAVRDAPPIPQKLYRGLSFPGAKFHTDSAPSKNWSALSSQLQPGKTIDMPLAGFSTSASQAGSFAMHVMLNLEPGAKGFVLGGRHAGESEVVTSGRFKVTSVTDAQGNPVTDMTDVLNHDDRLPISVGIKQEDVFDTDTRKAASALAVLSAQEFDPTFHRLSEGSMVTTAARTLVFKHPRTGDTHKRITDADYSHVSFKNGQIAWHTSEDAARRRSNEVYPVGPQGGSGSGGGEQVKRHTPGGYKGMWYHLFDDHGGRMPANQTGDINENLAELRRIHDREHTEERNLNHHHGAKLAYGETMAPAEVDTMRDELCPVCGEEDSFDGESCQVCGFVKPPDVFMDPDLDAAKVNDLRQEQDDEAIPGGGDLECPECGDTFASEHGAQTPQALDAFIPPGQEGDVQEASNAPGAQPPAAVDKPGDDKPPGKENPSLPKSGPTPDKDKGDDGSPPDTEPKAGDDCPTCGKGKLQPKKDADDKSNPPAKSKDGDEDKDSKDDPDGKDGKDDKKSLPPWMKKKQSLSAAEAAQAQKEQSMRPALAALAEQQRVIASQQAVIVSLSNRLSATENSLYALAKAAGFDDHPSIAAMASARQEASGLKLASLTVMADENNPAQPIPDNGSEAPVETTQQARQPDGTDDPNSMGASPVTDVSADGSADPTTEGGTVLTEALDLNEEDPTKSVAGTDTLGEGAPGQAGTNRTETDVQVTSPATDSAFTETGWKASSTRAFASLRLARLRIQAGVEDGPDVDDLSLGENIAGSDITDDAINAEIETLSKVVPKMASMAQQARQASQRQATNRNLVPRSAAGVGRSVPSMVTEPPVSGGAEGDGPDEALFE